MTPIKGQAGTQKILHACMPIAGRRLTSEEHPGLKPGEGKAAYHCMSRHVAFPRVTSSVTLDDTYTHSITPWNQASMILA